jgi:hypothetical protein
VINISGVVAGEGTTAAGLRALRWQPGGAAPEVLQSASGGGMSSAWSINSGVVAVGKSTTPIASARPSDCRTARRSSWAIRLTAIKWRAPGT